MTRNPALSISGLRVRNCAALGTDIALKDATERTLPAVVLQRRLELLLPLQQRFGAGKALHAFRAVWLNDDQLENVLGLGRPRLESHEGARTFEEPDHEPCIGRKTTAV
jgi:hypothetical protein